MTFNHSIKDQQTNWNETRKLNAFYLVGSHCLVALIYERSEIERKWTTHFLRYFVILICIICQKFTHYYCKCIFGFYEIYVLTYYGTLNIGSRIKYCTKNDKVYISLISLSFQYGRQTSQLNDTSTHGGWHLGPDGSAQIHWHVSPCKRHLSPMKLSLLIMSLGQGVIGLTCLTFFNMQKIPF